MTDKDKLDDILSDFRHKFCSQSEAEQAILNWHSHSLAQAVAEARAEKLFEWAEKKKDPYEVVHMLAIALYLYVLLPTNAEQFKTTLEGFNYKGKVLGGFTFMAELTKKKEDAEPLLDPNDYELCKNCGFGEWRHKQNRPYTCVKYEPIRTSHEQ